MKTRTWPVTLYVHGSAQCLQCLQRDAEGTDGFETVANSSLFSFAENPTACKTPQGFQVASSSTPHHQQLSALTVAKDQSQSQTPLPRLFLLIV